MMIRFFLFLLLLIFTSLVTPLLGQIHWLTWEEVQVVNKENPRKVIVDVYTEWCGWCKKMDKETFAQPAIAKYINNYFYAVKFDAGTKVDITFKDKVYKYVKSGDSGYHELAAEIMFGKLSYPTIVFIDEKLNILQPIPGFKDTSALDKIMKYFAEDYYKTTPWKKYEEMFMPSSTQPMPVKSGG